MLKIAIVGCGKMADQHAGQIKRIANTKIVAACDTEFLMAKQLCDRYNIPNAHTDYRKMILETDCEVIHLTTPPQTHYEIGKYCIQNGCHVYIEKPFTLDLSEAEQLISLAKDNSVKITAGHNAQFTHAMKRMRSLVKSGYLGDKPTHIESIYCYSFGNDSYANALLDDKTHWVRNLPGSLLQNIISHGISKIAEFITSDDPKVIAKGFTSPSLATIGQTDIIDEVRVIIIDKDKTTAYFSFSSQIKPSLHQFRIFGQKQSLIVDDDHQIVIKLNNKEYKSYLRYMMPLIEFSYQYLKGFMLNLIEIVKNDFHLPFDSGLKTLIENFYSSIIDNSEPPISYREILLTTKIMDQIFSQIR